MEVISKNENVLDEMIEILSEVHQYVPSKRCDTVDAVTQKVFDDSIVHGILIGGDQLTRKRIETAKELAKNGISPDMELKGLIPICHGWHTKKVFLEVGSYMLVLF